jgi:NTP pyrophosphatase (non-canonical NTP hydrolase)
MTLDDYQRKAFATARINWNDPRGRHIPAFGVVGELGSLTTEIKKSIRDGEAYTEGPDNLTEEFGDLLWYVSAVASRHDLQLQILSRRTKPLTVRRSAFGHVYAMVSAVATLVALVEEYDAEPTARKKRLLAKALGTTLQTTLAAIQREKLDLAKVLRTNLRKGKGMFGASSVHAARCFDAKYPGYERLPRSMNVQFLERERGPGQVEVVLLVNHVNIGDRLTDNAHRDDGYRFHDAFHFAYAAVLGWSPVVRATLRCKRKSVPKIDEVQDGARAAIVEEAIAQTIFNYARGHSMLAGLDRIDHGILKLIQRMVRGLEVEKCELHEWQRAILVGFEAFRALKDNRGGWLILDAETRGLGYSSQGPVAG